MIRMILIYTGLFVAAAGALWLRPDGATVVETQIASAPQVEDGHIFLASFRPTARPAPREAVRLDVVDSVAMAGFARSEDGTTGIASLVMRHLEEDASSASLAGVVTTADGAVDLAPLLEIPGSIRGSDGTRILASALMQRRDAPIASGSLQGQVSDVVTLSVSPVSDDERFYTVKAGDSLGSIAREFYGSSNAFREIYQANKDVLSSIDAVRVGQRLRLP